MSPFQPLTASWPAPETERLPLRTTWKQLSWEIETRVRWISRELLGGDENFRPLSFDPEDTEALSERGDAIYSRELADKAADGQETARRVLQIMGESFPTPTLSEAYLAHLAQRLAQAPALATPGRLVIGLGTGRSGSTTLAARLGATPNSCSTHENPPLVFWTPKPEQASLHFRRFELLSRRHDLVADCAHWWLGLVDELVVRFPSVKFIGLVRDRFDCAVSFARLKGLGPGTYNHWAHEKRDLGISALWDPTYPKFEPPNWAHRRPDRAKLEMIEKYWDLYNAKLFSFARKYPERFLLLSTKRLDEPECVKKIYEFVGAAPVVAPRHVKLNVKSTRDGRQQVFKV